MPNEGAGAALWPPRQRTFADAWSSDNPTFRREEELIPALGFRIVLKPLPKLDSRRFCLAQTVCSVLCTS